MVIGVASMGPAARAELKTGDVILVGRRREKVADQGAELLAGSSGRSGAARRRRAADGVYHEGVTFDVTLASIDRMKLP